MCPGSLLAHRHVSARRGTRYQISKTAYRDGGYLHGVLHEMGKGLEQNGYAIEAACIHVQTHVTLLHIPNDVQQEFGIGRTHEAIFIPGTELGPDEPDRINFLNGEQTHLYDLAGRSMLLKVGTVVEEDSYDPRDAERQQRRELETA